MKLHYAIDGPADAPPLVLVNGLFADLHSWDGVMNHLSDFRVLRFDGRGQGQSPKPEGPYRLELLLADLLELLGDLAWPPSFYIGLSNGGCLALALAAAHPQRVSALVAADCYDHVSPLLHLKIDSWLVAHKVGGPTHRFDVATPWIWSESLLERQPELVDFYRNKAAAQPDAAVRGLIEGALTHQIHIETISCPVLFIVGEQDLLTPPFSVQTMAKRLAQSQFETVRGGHASLLEYPQTTGDVLVPFFRGIDRSLLTHVD